MQPTIPVKKLFRIAFFTSILMGALGIAPIALAHSASIVEFFRGIIQHTLVIFFIWSVNILIVYLTEKYRTGRFSVYSRYVLSYIICVALLSFLRVFMTPMPGEHDMEILNHKEQEMPFGSHGQFVGIIMGFALNTIVLIIQDLILLREKKARIELEYAELKIKNVEATNQQLKQQIHPHFLFNSLNTLKTLIKKNPDKAEEYLIMLSDFLRASISADTPNVIKLKDEIKLCMDYLEMQKIRFGEALQYTINIPESIQNSSFVPVFSLLPLLENAVKHNSLTTEFPLHIKIEYENGWIITSNNIQAKLTIESSTGLGLENLSERYKLLSADKIITNKSETLFSVSIKILDSENSNHRR
jgi:two-component system, LytTR family, sensor kinase